MRALVLAMMGACGALAAPLPEGGPYLEQVDLIWWTFMVQNYVSGVGKGTSSGKAIQSVAAKGAITIPSTLGERPVRNINTYAFFNYDKMTSMTIPSSVRNIGDYAFAGCSGLTSLSIGSGVKNIGVCAFSNCSGLRSLAIPEGVESLGASAFSRCTKLVIVTIPSTVKNIEENAFGFCTDLRSIDVDTGNAYYASQDHVLFTRDGKRLMCYPAGRSSGNYTVPSGVVIIDTLAFAGSWVKGVNMPSSVSTIGLRAFIGCGVLTSVTIPASVTSIGSSAFTSCDKLSSVVFEGAPPKGVESAGFDPDASIRYNVEHFAAWQPVIKACGWTNAKPYGELSGTMMFFAGLKQSATLLLSRLTETPQICHNTPQ